MRSFIRLTLLGLCLMATDAAAWTSMAPVTNPPRPIATASNRVGVMSQFNLGDVFVGVAGGQYYHYTNAGAYLETLQQPQTGFTTGCICQRLTSNLYTTGFSDGHIYAFDAADPHPIILNINTAANGSQPPESIVLANNGDILVGNAFNQPQRYDAAGVFQEAYPVTGGTDWIELAADQKTLFYDYESPIIYRYDISTQTQLTDFAAPGGTSFALRLLPPGDGSGGMLVAHQNEIIRLDGSGNVVQVYDAAGEDTWFSLNLDPNGTSFWSGNFGSSNFYKFDIASGAVELGPINTGTGPSSLYGICVNGERQAGCFADTSAPHFTAPVCGSEYTVNAGSNISISVSASDPDTGDVFLTVAGPGGSTFVSVPGNPATGQFDWTPTLLDQGDNAVTFYATDGCNAESCSVLIHVVTNRAPVCSLAVASEPVLWPPSHKYHAISILGVTDPDGDPVTITVTGVTQDEPVNTRGDGNTCPDAQIVEGEVSVRAERTGTVGIPGNGRVYSINFTASDGNGGECSGSVTVCVPHDQSDPTCIDDGQRYNSLGPCTGGGELHPEAAASYSLKVGRVAGNEASVTFGLPVDAKVQIAVFDVAGRRLATVENARLSAGTYQRSLDMRGISNGLYFVRMQANEVTLTRTVLKAE